MAFPIDDWQFWVVTTLVLGVVFLAVRSIVRGSTAKRGKTRVSLTVERREIEPADPNENE